MDMGDWQEKLGILAKKSLRRVTFWLQREYSPRGLTFIFIAALLLGALAKSLANDSLTIGHDDYKLARPEKIIDLNLLEKSLIQKKGDAPEIPTTPKGESCAPEKQ